MFDKIKAFLIKAAALFSRLGEWKWAVVMVLAALLVVLAVSNKVFGVVAALILAVLAYRKGTRVFSK